MLQALQQLSSLFTLFAALTYLVGGLIVNIHLGKYRITEYQLLSIDYLIVGLVFLWNLCLMLIVPFIPATFVLAFERLHYQPGIYGGIGVSIIGTLGYLVWMTLYSHLPAKLKKNKVIPFLLSSLAIIYPLSVILRFVSPSLSDIVPEWEKSVAAAIGAFQIGGITINYAWRVYGNPVDETTDDIGGGIGRGVPRSVQLAGDEEKLALLVHVGIPLVNDNLSSIVYLIGETNTQYIVTRSLEDDSEAIKVNKDTVSAIRYLRNDQASSDNVSKEEKS